MDYQRLGLYGTYVNMFPPETQRRITHVSLTDLKFDTGVLLWYIVYF